jgi:hypothetical protein
VFPVRRSASPVFSAQMKLDRSVEAFLARAAQAVPDGIGSRVGGCVALAPLSLIAEYSRRDIETEPIPRVGIQGAGSRDDRILSSDGSARRGVHIVGGA